MSLVNLTSKIFSSKIIGAKVLNAAKTVPTKKYALLEKTEKLPIANYPKDKWVFPEAADTFNIVKVGKANDPNYFKEITNFYNKEGKLVKRCTKGSDINNQTKDYEYDFYCHVNEPNPNIYGAETRKVTTQEYVITPELKELKKTHPEMSQYIYGEWRTKSQELQAVSKLYKGDYTRYPKKLTVIKNTFNQDIPDRMTAEMVEYPFTRGYEPQSTKKILGLELEIKNDIPHIIGTNQTTNVKIPTNDKFLPFRLYIDREAQQVALTRYFLKKRGLENLNIRIETNSKAVEENAAAHFSSINGTIAYKKISKYSPQVGTVSHEVEHAYQHSLIGRIGKANTEYEKKCAEIFPKIESKTMKKEALDYAKARDKYPKLSRTEDLSQNKDYYDNLLEIKAREAGKLAEDEYNTGKKFLTDQFKYALDGNVL